MIRKIARPMLASVYIAEGVDNLKNTQAHVEETEYVLKKVRTLVPPPYDAQIPGDAQLVTRALGGAKVGAGSLLALGKAPRLSASVLALTAVPTIIGRHAFWEAKDAEEKAAKRSGFLTSIALLGGLGITSMDTAGKPGLAWRASHAAKVGNKKLQAALPTQSQTESALDQAGSWINEKAEQAQETAKQASEAVSSYVDDNKDDWKKTAATAAAAASGFIGNAAEQGKSLASDVQSEAPKWAEQARERSAELLDRADKNSRAWLEQAQKDTKTARKRVVKAAGKAQDRAQKAQSKLEKKANGRGAKKAARKAEDLQARADAAIGRAKARIEG
ncbi:DoxX family protein [Corynebacterium tapiri]|uniref:DoxX family membrane protein n=1 Tax=Corynebacterium tapiri TaxID=1448266 RepID=A0A5C4U616_9CORY|nr:DoxX family protein [Corynebacterium tapiri]TNL99840.1 DoxX family membrane protein [Corynebacterium tapiri]